MFGKKKNKAIQIKKLSSLIADNVEVVGDVVFKGGLRVDGRVQGNVINLGDERGLLVLSDRGCIEGNVSTFDAVVNGTIIGNLSVGHFVELQPNARVTGNITYNQLQMDCGAAVEGKLVKTGEDDVVDSKIVDLSGASSSAASAAGGGG